MITLPQLLKAMLEHRASDMHITSGCPPVFRVHGQILKAKSNSLTPADTKELCYSVLTDYQKAQFEEAKQLDFSFGIRDLARFPTWSRCRRFSTYSVRHSSALFAWSSSRG